MSQQLASGTAQKMLKDWFAANHPTIPVRFPNAPFSGPDNAPYAEFFWMRGKTIRSSIGSNAYRVQVGLLQLNVVVQEDVGSGEAVTICEEALKIFDDTQIKLGSGESLTFRLSSVDTEEPMNGKYVVIGSVPWEQKKIIRRAIA